MLTQSRRRFLLFPLLCLLSLSVVRISCAPDPGVDLQAVRARYKSVNHCLGRSTKVVRDLPGRSTEGGTLIGYRSDPSFCKVTAIYYGETGKAVEEYYFRHGHLFFVILSKTIYDQPLGAHRCKTPAGTVARSSQERFYLSEEKLIRWSGDRKLLQTSIGKTIYEQGRQLVGNARQYLALLSSEPSR